MERPISKSFGSPISLESVLKLVAADAGLVFVCEDEVIKIVSPEYRKANTFQKHYYVGDLVAPIPDMMAPTYMSFMSPGNAVNTVGGSVVPGATFTPDQNPLTLSVPQQGGAINQAALAQQLPGSPFAGPLGGLPVVYGGGRGPQSGTPMYNQIAPQLLGGITQQDFDDLIQLIQETIEPPSWDDENASIRPFVSTLSLVVRQTQDVHDQIEDLLRQLRDLNDVQIVIEVRFITLQDNFFERIGVDFDFNIEDNAPLTPGTNIPDRVGGTTVIGQVGSQVFPSNFDVGLTQDSFTSAIPQFGGFDAATAANFGFAILSDIEVFFLLQASQGDTRSNVLQAPTVTVTNGQVATVNDNALRPFVTSVIPVVGDFAAAQQPIITILPEGSSLNVRATASNDRRFVTLTLVPMFSQITDVSTFTFEGRRVVDQFGSTDDNTGGNGNGNGNGNGGGDSADDVIIDGTTVQLPTLAFTSVQTTVNVPDGGTILLGGIKRLSEGRNERGVPFLSKLPYINRLFKNVGIGRDTSSLMMMVTPRVIIQQEEERRQVGNVSN
jgi:general secretion pathway protein D